MRICSGKFEAGMEVMHIQGGKKIRLAQPQQMMAQERHMVEEAYAGDIIGVFDPGIFSIGDTLTTSSDKFSYEGNHPDCAGRCDPDFSGVSYRYGRDHCWRSRCPAV